MSCAKRLGSDHLTVVAATKPARRRLGALWLAGTLGLTLHAYVHSQGHDGALPPAQGRAAEALGDATDQAAVPDIAARFRVTLTPRGGRAQVQQWWLNRSTHEIGWIKGPNTEEVWRRDSSGIRLERVMRADRHVIDYSAGEFRTLEVALDWRELGSLFAEHDLDLLTAIKPSSTPIQPIQPTQPTQPIQHYQGRINGERVDLLWDARAHLPLRLDRQGKAGRVLYERVAMHRSVPTDWPRAGATTDNFQRLDAADFGDMEYNPVVRRAQARDERAGWRNTHAD